LSFILCYAMNLIFLSFLILGTWREGIFCFVFANLTLPKCIITMSNVWVNILL
jgi:hypothetical protein